MAKGADPTQVAAGDPKFRLENRVQLLPTPLSRDWKDGRPVDGVPVGSVLGRVVWSLLPTPVASGWEYSDEDLAKRREMGRAPLLSEAARELAIGRRPALLPTPRATRGGSSTESQALLPTPNTLDHIEKRTTHAGGNPTLQGAVGGVSPTDAARHAARGGSESQALMPTPRAADYKGATSRSDTTDQRAANGTANLPEFAVSRLLPTPMVGSTSDAAHGQISGQFRADMADALARFGEYAGAVARWESVIGRPAPDATERGRLSPRFVEWMMGLPEGWVTDVPGLRRPAQLKALGNGVVPQHAAEALQRMITVARMVDSVDVVGRTA